MKTLLPDPGMFDPTETRPNSNVGPIQDRDIKVLPVWKPDAPNKDAQLARIDSANLDGQYGSLDGNHPKHDERTSGTLTSEQLHTGQGEDASGPDAFARSGGSKPRK